MIQKKAKQETFESTIVEKKFIEETWKLKYQNLMLETLEEEKLETSIKLGIGLFELFHDFGIKATVQVIDIINELSLPECLRKNIPKKVMYPPIIK